MKKLQNISKWLTAVPLLLLAFMFIAFPLFGMIRDSFLSTEGSVTLANYMEIMSKPVYHSAIRNSLYLSFLSTVIGLAVSFLMALSITQIGERSQGIVQSILNMTSNFAGLPLSFAFVVILGNSGILIAFLSSIGIGILENFNLYSVDGLLLLFIYFQLPLGTLMLLPAFQGVKAEWKEAAELMGASPFYFWIKVGIPVIFSSLADTCSLLFANALTAYATIVMLVTTNVPILAVKITSMFTGEMAQQKELGSALSIVVLLIMFAVICICNILKKSVGKER